jgi:hypothetical protein
MGQPTAGRYGDVLPSDSSSGNGCSCVAVPNRAASSSSAASAHAAPRSQSHPRTVVERERQRAMRLLRSGSRANDSGVLESVIVVLPMPSVAKESAPQVVEWGCYLFLSSLVKLGVCTVGVGPTFAIGEY